MVEVELRAEVTPPGPYRLPRPSPEGVAAVRGGVLHRLLHLDGVPVLLRAAVLASGTVVLGARSADRALAARGLHRWRVALDCDRDLRPFLRAHRDDRYIGPSVRRRPWLRPAGRACAFEALLCAVCEQLIAYEDAVRIERRLVWRHGRRCAVTGLRDGPDAAAVVAAGTAGLEACGLAPGRAIALHRAAREIVAGRIDPDGDPERALLRLSRIPGIGTWTTALVAGQALGLVDRAPSGDLNLVKAVGRMRTGDPRARVTEAEVDALLERYAPWTALGAAHLMATRPEALPRDPGAGALPADVVAPAAPRRDPAPAPRRAPVVRAVDVDGVLAARRPPTPRDAPPPVDVPAVPGPGRQPAKGPRHPPPAGACAGCWASAWHREPCCCWRRQPC